MHKLRSQFHRISIMMLSKDPAAQPVPCFQQQYIHAGSSKALRRGHSGNSRADDNHIRRKDSSCFHIDGQS